MISSLLALLSFLGWLYLALMNGKFWKPLLDAPAPEPDSWPSVDIVVPARNEAESLPHSLPSLLEQDYPGAWRVLLVDDHSTDFTTRAARQIAFDKGRTHKLTVMAAPDLPPGWSGKVAAMQAGVEQSKSDYVLFTDADIEHPADSLRHLVARALYDKLDLASLMVKLHCANNIEKLLIPAFVFFFAMLYPFRRANDPFSRTAAAAGGVMLVKKQALANIGGLERIKAALIDDCALARAIKDGGGPDGATGRIRLTLTEDVKSLRVYATVREAMHMISRAAFTQLGYSTALLAGTVLGLGLLFFVPVLVPLFANFKAALFAFPAWFLMIALYRPMARFYNLPFAWALTLPAAAAIYMAATIDSARQYWQGKGGQWKGRAQAS
ncbi:MAG: glycosyltransferase [Alphaproteobacteria bacterium]|nr:glycosyltransferase [Alphaproteobacteria bacterium]